MESRQIYQPLRDPRSTWLEVRGIRYHVSEWGDPAQPPVVMLHGWGDCGATFQFLVDAMRSERHFVAPDWRGFGRSFCRAEGYWFPDYLADLDALLDRIAPGQPVDLVGHSMGGNVAGLFAGVFPERVNSFVNLEGFGLPDSDPASAPAHYRAWIEKSRGNPAYREYDDFDQLAERVQRQSPHMPLERAQFVARQWADRNADGRVRLRADPAHKLPNPVQYRRAEAEACWRAIAAPVLLVSGSETRFRRLLDGWPEAGAGGTPFRNAESVEVAEAGHMVHFEQPGRLAEVVERFLAANGG